MTITRAQLEEILVSHRGPLMQAADLAVTVAGANADLVDPIGYAIRKLSGVVASLTTITDADIATVPAADTDALLDIAELRLLMNIKGNLALVDITSGPQSEKLSQLVASVHEDIETLQAQIAASYGAASGATLEAGVLSLDFMENTEND